LQPDRGLPKSTTFAVDHPRLRRFFHVSPVSMLYSAGYRRLLIGASALLLTACGHALNEIPGFDAAAWRHDPYACQNKRAALLPALNQHRDLLYDTRTDAIDALLGHPDEEELSEQTEKIYLYYIEPGTQCTANHPRSGANKLRLRFSPTGIVSEVLYDKPLSSAVPAQ